MKKCGIFSLLGRGLEYSGSLVWKAEGWQVSLQIFAALFAVFLAEWLGTLVSKSTSWAIHINLMLVVGSFLWGILVIF